ncbi:MAG TPA: tetratricopeptide repeat protein [Planctomycetota bacterium]|nr:tetratricopeptide repeat protein [Planctomycetota bacterium]
MLTPSAWQEAAAPLCYNARMNADSGNCGGGFSRHAIACFFLAVLTLGVFSNALRNEFVSFDDWFLIEENERIRSLSPESIVVMFSKRDPSSHAWLPLRELSYAVDYRLSGLLPVGYHLTNVLLHTANVLLVYAVLVWLLGRAECRVRAAEGGPRTAHWLAALGAAAFAVHPAQVESVAWASGRRDVLYAFFFLLAFLAFVAHERRGGWWRWVLYGASLFFLLASLCSKASAMTLPAVLFLAILVSGEEAEEGFWRRLWATVPHWVVAFGLTVWHMVTAQQAGVVKGEAFGASLANVPLIFAEYGRLLFFPVHLVAPHGDATLHWASDGARILVLAGVTAGLVALAWWAAPRRGLAVFGLGWWFLLLLPVANVVPISILVAERYLYLPLVGVCALGVGVIGSLMTTRWHRRVVLTCAVAALALFGMATHRRNQAWANSRTFWQDGVSKWPRIPVMRIGLATAYVDANDYERAWEQYMMVALSWGRAASTDPEHVSLVNRGLAKFYDSLGRQREAEGRPDAALEVYGTMVRLLQKEKSVEPWVRLAQACERMGRWEKAREAVLAVQKLEPEHPGLADWLKRLEEQGKGATGVGPKE